jgi:uncharacterized Zn-finger protein
MEWKCLRCGHESSCKGNLIKHLKKKKECITEFSFIDREHYINNLTNKEYNESTFDCVYCGKKFNTASNKYRHHKICSKSKETTENTSNEVIIKMLKELLSRQSNPNISFNGI